MQACDLKFIDYKSLFLKNLDIIIFRIIIFRIIIFRIIIFRIITCKITTDPAYVASFVASDDLQVKAPSIAQQHQLHQENGTNV